MSGIDKVQSLSPLLVSLQIGMPRQHGIEGATEPMERPWFSGFVKDSVEGRVWLSKTGLSGDGVADTKHHGGEEKAVMVYASSHYSDWARQLDIEQMPPASFGENFTVSGLTEETVCIGDTFAVGDVRQASVVQVSQPRQPCWKQERRLGRRGVIALMVDSGRTGWYFRVLREGWVCAGTTLYLLDRPFPEWTVARANRLRHHFRSGERRDRDATAQLAECPFLSPSWQTALRRRATGGDEPDTAPRIIGPGVDAL